MNWLLFLSQLPANPSSLRVNVWRKLRAAGALGLQNGVWLLPDHPENADYLQDLLKMIQAQGASGQIFKVSALTGVVEEDVLQRFNEERNQEYDEFLDGTRDFLVEMQMETEKEKFTFAELEENEQNLQRLGTWLERIQRRDFAHAGKANAAGQSLTDCQKAFDAFSAIVYRSHTGEYSTGSDTQDRELNITDKKDQHG